MQTETELPVLKTVTDFLPGGVAVQTQAQDGEHTYTEAEIDQATKEFVEPYINQAKSSWLSQLRKEIEGAIGEDESEKTSMHPTAASLRKAELRNKLRAELRTKLANLLQETK